MKNPLQKILTPLLNQAEKHTKTNMRYLLKNGSWMLLRHTILLLGSLAQNYFFANLLTPSIFGSFRYLITLANTFGATLLTGMNTAVTQATARDKDGVLHQSFLTQIKWSIIFLSLCILTGGYYFIRGNTIFATSLFLLGILFPLANSANTFIAYWNGKKDFRTLSCYSSIVSFVSALFTILSLFFTNNLLILVGVFFGSNAILNLFFYQKTLKQIQNTDTDPDSLKYGKQLSGINVFTIIAAHLDKLLIFQFLGPVPLAIYHFATAIPEQMKGILKIIPSLALPKFAEQKNTIHIDRILFQKIGKMALLVGVLVCCYILAVPFLFSWFFPQYLESVFYTQIFSVVLIFSSISLVITSFLQAKMDVKKLSTYAIITSLLQIVVLFFAIQYYGLLGAILAKVILEATNTLILLGLSQKRFTFSQS